MVFKFDLPGLKSDQVKVSVHDRLLTVTGERHEEREEKHEGYLSRERAIGRFERSVRLPENLQQDDVEASFSDGVLTVRVPRAGESTPRRGDHHHAVNRSMGRPASARSSSGRIDAMTTPSNDSMTTTAT